MSNDIQHNSFWKSPVANDQKKSYVTKKQVMESKLFLKGFVFALVCCLIGAGLGFAFYLSLTYSPIGTTIGVAVLTVSGVTYFKYQEYKNELHKDNENSK